MGKVEKTAREVARRDTLRYALLSVIQIAGLVSVAVVVPNALSAMVKLGIVPHPRQMELLRRSSSRLVLKGFLVWKDRKLQLTPKGEREIRRLEVRVAQPTPRKWDGKWRILMFDIPEYRKALRQKIRTMLRTIGFVRLQDSVWVYPYDCEDLITLLKADMRVGRDVVYLVANAIEGDARLRRNFKLPKQT